MNIYLKSKKYFENDRIHVFTKSSTIQKKQKIVLILSAITNLNTYTMSKTYGRMKRRYIRSQFGSFLRLVTTFLTLERSIS